MPRITASISALPLFIATAYIFANPGHAAAAPNSTASQVLPLLATAHGTALTAQIQVGNQTFELLLDTGSSDLWVLGSDWGCYEKSESGILGEPVAREQCAYGNGTLTPSPTFRANEEAWLGEHYGAGDVLGTVGSDVVRIGNITLARQEFGIANATNGPADEFSEGIMGLGYPILSQTHPANFTAETSFDLLSNTLPSKTVLMSLVDALDEPYFAFALERIPRHQETAFGGYVSFGMLPPVQHSSDWTTAPVEIIDSIPTALTQGTRQRTYWATTVDSISWGNETFDTPYQAVVDTGNFYFIVPSRLAERVARHFQPPGVLQPDGVNGPVYAVHCNATPPSSASIELGGKAFAIDSEDLIYRDFDGECYSTFAPTVPLQGIELFFLSSHFLRNVVAVFDYQHNEMRFAERFRSERPSVGEPPLQVVNGGSQIEALGMPWVAFSAVLLMGIIAVC